MNAFFRRGFVEGFYGRPWSWNERTDAAAFLAGAGYEFYLYAPKGDLHLRRRWREPWPAETALELSRLVSRFHALGLSFGVGLSPMDTDEPSLLKKVEEIEKTGADHLALLFDDMNGSVPELARKQIALAHAVRARWAGELSFCPSYYSLDPLLDRMFGPRPAGYLEELGEGLDASIEIFWTGEKICSKSYSLKHLQEVSAWLRRKPLLWDNYPVNDTERMSAFLHLSPFTGRPEGLSGALSGHLVNPMLQPVLSRIPALTLTHPRLSFEAVAATVAGEALGALLVRDRALFEEQGLEKISAPDKAALKREYAAFAHPCAREIVGWLDGHYSVLPETIQAQQ